MNRTTSHPSVEDLKASSRGLRGELAEGLDAGGTSVHPDSAQLLKFHGIYAGDDRDQRRARHVAGQAPAHQFMTRVVVPGGRLSATQWLALDHLADEVADGTLRLTTRQAIQFHGVAKAGLRPLARALDAALLTSFGACGDVVRNIVACPSLTSHQPPAGWQELVDHLSARSRPASTAWWEVFVGGELAMSRLAPDEVDPRYGTTYLPRKFKIGIAHPEDNCIDAFAQDLAFVASAEGGRQPRFQVLVGGGLGSSYANTETFPRLASHLTDIEIDQVDAVVDAVVSTFADLGRRDDRRRARMKYLVADLGLDAFRAEVERRFGQPLPPPRDPWQPPSSHDHLGWRAAPDGTWQLGLAIPGGRVADREGIGLRSALRLLATSLELPLTITTRQDLILGGIADAERPVILESLRDHGVALPDELRPLRRRALACVALPTCGQALAEAERVLPTVLDAMENTLSELDLANRALDLRITGCPNGCARPGVAEIALVGRTKSTYDLYLGGRPEGDRLNRRWREKVRLEEVPGLLRPLLAAWGATGEEEGFGDFVTRVGLP